MSREAESVKSLRSLWNRGRLDGLSWVVESLEGDIEAASLLAWGKAWVHFPGSIFLGPLFRFTFFGSFCWPILLAHFLGPLSSNHFPGYTFLGPLFSDHFLGSNFLGSLPSVFFLGPTFTVNQNQIINIDQQSATQQCLVSTYVMKHDSFFGRSYSLLIIALR